MSSYHPITQPPAELAINHMRHLLRRCRISAWWSEQNKEVREGICRAAALKPVAYWDKRLEDMTDDEREAIRRAVVALKQALAGFSATDRSEWLHVPDFAGAESGEEVKQAEQQRREELHQQARRLQQRAKKLKAAQL
ncbi:hypothetical protein [Oceanisphaera psychrotolerans]|uniref:Uncharacterized protein n=1 Tax=Oceanisphaera psychrotolerans TaxID=1414654 RepID=A0A1J4QG94_9GAMM|nr:hypothetical protein [Oceanisphaera psychrotolerans]OIN09099.1 hypothetical protein BFR47_02140 [Oceanisphaera psychrotolerans]